MKEEPDKARVRAKVEHSFRIPKRIFGLVKVEVPGLEEEPRSFVRGLRAGEPLSTPQTAGTPAGVVCPVSAEKRSPLEKPEPVIPERTLGAQNHFRLTCMLPKARLSQSFPMPGARVIAILPVLWGFLGQE